MFFYVAGSLLFIVAMICALTVTLMTFRRYRDQMVVALRSLSVDSIHAPKQSAVAGHPVGLRSKLV
jgi:hypothetical protein